MLFKGGNQSARFRVLKTKGGTFAPSWRGWTTCYSLAMADVLGMRGVAESEARLLQDKVSCVLQLSSRGTT